MKYTIELLKKQIKEKKIEIKVFEKQRGGYTTVIEIKNEIRDIKESIKLLEHTVRKKQIFKTLS